MKRQKDQSGADPAPEGVNYGSERVYLLYRHRLHGS
jgi:hypothetical protein